MTSILGFWQINVNDSEGALRLFLDNQGNLQGKMTFQDAQRVDDVTNISWNDAAGEISFVRHLGQTNVTQTYTGFLGDNHADQLLSLAGWFTESDIPATAPRTRFGWFARQPQPATQYVVISGPFNVSESLTDLLADPVVGEGPYFVDTLGLQAPLTIQWTGGPGTTIAAPTAPSTTIDCDMTGQVRRGGGKVFDVSVQVTDQFGVSGSARAGISVHVFDDSKGGG